MVKPDGVQRGKTGTVIKHFETKGFKLVAMKLVHPDKAHFEKHYADLSKKPFFNSLTTYMASGPVCAMIWEGDNIVKTGRKGLGQTKPFDSNSGSLRGDHCIDIGMNMIHGSDSVDSANAEIAMWFKPEELNSWEGHSACQLYE
jgi:nucleoside-diphosphate kinase